jgi:molybdenum cofactor cytidylyltransferase
MKIAAVILAAGLSSRMGAFKPLLRLGETSLLGHCRALFAAAGLEEMIVAVGHRAGETLAEAESLGMKWACNPDYDAGMFSSLRCAAAALPEDIDAFFVLPVDIPLVRSATLRAMLAAFPGDDSVLYPVFAGRRGHPPLIPASLIPRVLDHDGVGGLRNLLRQCRGADVAVWDEGIHLDADTPEDLQRLQHRLARISVPTRPEVEALAEILLSEQGLVHARLVGRAAIALADTLSRQGYRLDRDLLYGGALLHDVAKGEPRHEVRGAEMLSALGVGEIAGIVAAHKDLEPPISGRLTEKEIVCLADKLISGPRRVRIDEGYAEKLMRCAADTGACQEIIARKTRALALMALVEKAAARGVETILDEAGL